MGKELPFTLRTLLIRLFVFSNYPDIIFYQKICTKRFALGNAFSCALLCVDRLLVRATTFANLNHEIGSCLPTNKILFYQFTKLSYLLHISYMIITIDTMSHCATTRSLEFKAKAEYQLLLPYSHHFTECPNFDFSSELFKIVDFGVNCLHLEVKWSSFL